MAEEDKEGNEEIEKMSQREHMMKIMDSDSFDSVLQITSAHLAQIAEIHAVTNLARKDRKKLIQKGPLRKKKRKSNN